MTGWQWLQTSRGIAAAGLPTLPDRYVPRPRLHRRLDEAIEHAQVVQIVAPVASGKTTLISGWHAAGSSPVMAYLALDHGDADIRHLWTRIIGALRQPHPSWGVETLDLLTSSEPPPQPEAVLERLVAELDQLGRTVLVLDGLEALHGPTTKVLGDFLLDLPDSLQVVLCGRAEPPLRQGLLRARGRLVEIHARELAFDQAELRVFLQGFEGLDVDEDDSVALAERTEGWVGGTKLVALALEEHDDAHAFLTGLSGANRYIADLLAEEVFEPQTPETQDFLLATSVLDSLDARLCDLVTHGTGSAARLEQLERSGMFVEAVDDQRSVFRYQPLFSEFLRHRLHLLDPERENDAHRAAGRAYEARGEVSEAIGHYLAGQRPDGALRLVVEHGQRFAAMGKVDTLRRWLAAWPEGTRTSDLAQMMEITRLCVMAGMRDEAVTWLARTRWQAETSDDPALRAQQALLSGFAYAILGNLEAAIPEAQRVLKLAETEGPEAIEDSLVAKAQHLLAGAYAGLDEFEAARRHRDAAPSDEEAEVPMEAYSAWLSYREGDLDLALGYANELLARSSLPWQWGTPLVARGAVRRERNQLNEAEVDLTRALDLSRQWSRPRIVVFASIELALVRFAQGRTSEAFEMLEAARAETHGPALRERVEAARATLWQREGDLERSARARRELTTGRLTAPLDVRLALAAEQPDRARIALAEFERVRRSRQDEIVAWLLRARVGLVEAGTVAADELVTAIEFGRPLGFVQVFVDDLPALAADLRRLVAARPTDGYSHGLLAAITDRPRVAPAASALVEPLSAREAVVLRYLQTSLSNREVALELHMSVNTLKTHLKSIYRKLGVGSRSAAVAAARQQRIF
jgi:LuxR family maltose regulon positive regulatory protein